MSSSLLLGLVEAPGVGGQGAVDDVGQVALEDAEGFAGFADGGGAAVQEGFSAVVAAGLDEGGAVDGGVDLAVAAAVETVDVAGAAGGGDGGGAVALSVIYLTLRDVAGGIVLGRLPVQAGHCFPGRPPGRGRPAGSAPEPRPCHATPRHATPGP